MSNLNSYLSHDQQLKLGIDLLGSIRGNLIISRALVELYVIIKDDEPSTAADIELLLAHGYPMYLDELESKEKK